MTVLQKELGPGQRISASGGQQLGESNLSGRKNWVGTYDSWPATAETRPSPVFRKFHFQQREVAAGVHAVQADAGKLLAGAHAVFRDDRFHGRSQGIFWKSGSGHCSASVR
jgi:hypothetical protein